MHKRSRTWLLVGVALVAFVGIAAAAVGTVPITQNDDGVILNQPGGPTLNLTGNTDLYATSGGVDSSTIQFNTTDGNLSASATGDAQATIAVSEVTGPWTNLTAVDATSADLTVAPADKARATVAGSVTGLRYREAAGIGVSDNQPDLVYSAVGSGTITLRNLPASTSFRAVTASGTDLGTVSTDGSGVGTLSVSVESDAPVYFMSVDAPSIDSTSPGDGAQINSSDVTLEASISDQDFADGGGDELSVTFYVDGSQVGTDTLTSNGTASTSTSISDGGNHTWSVEVTDRYGETVSSQTFDLLVPSTMFIRSETNPGELINATDVQITAYYAPDEVQRRTVQDGRLNLTGFPVDQPIIIRANATNNTARTAVVENIYQQNSIYLLNESADQVLIRFQLQQVTGEFASDETVLFVERDIELNGSVEWRTVAGDQFGVEGIPMSLQQDERYRLRIKNLDTSETAVIGAYTPVDNETVTVSAGSATINFSDLETPYGWNVTENESANEIVVQYADEAGQTDEILITIHERFNRSNVLVDNVSYTSTDSLVYQVPLTANQTNKTWTAELYIDRGDGYMHFRVPISGGPRSILPEGLDPVWANAVGVFVMLIAGMAFSRLNLGVGAVSTSLVGGLLWWVGLLSQVAIGPAIVAAICVAVVYHYRTSSSGVRA